MADPAITLIVPQGEVVLFTQDEVAANAELQKAVDQAYAMQAQYLGSQMFTGSSILRSSAPMGKKRLDIDLTSIFGMISKFLPLLPLLLQLFAGGGLSPAWITALIEALKQIIAQNQQAAVTAATQP